MSNKHRSPGKRSAPGVSASHRCDANPGCDLRPYPGYLLSLPPQSGGRCRRRKGAARGCRWRRQLQIKSKIKSCPLQPLSAQLPPLRRGSDSKHLGELEQPQFLQHRSPGKRSAPGVYASHRRDCPFPRRAGEVPKAEGGSAGLPIAAAVGEREQNQKHRSPGKRSAPGVYASHRSDANPGCGLRPYPGYLRGAPRCARPGRECTPIARASIPSLRHPAR